MDKVFAVLFSLSAIASTLASLEPAGYRPPGLVSTASQYLPPRVEPQRTPTPPSTQHSSDVPPSPSPYYYLPPQVQLRPQKPPAPSPSTNYLPAVDKPPSTSSVVPPPSPPSNTYLPPLSPSPPTAPTTEYLPPATRPASVPAAAYLPPSSGAGRKAVPTKAPVPRPSVLPDSGFKGGYGEPKYSRPTTSSLAPLPTARRDEYPQQSKAFLPPAAEQPTDNYLPPPPPPPIAAKSSDVHAPADQPRHGYGAGAALDKATTEPAKYAFEYRVSDEFGNDFSHKEMRDGSQTQGFYSVLLPDGRLQRVAYTADETGFRPKISYEEAATVLGPKTPDVAGYDSNVNSLNTQGPY